MEYFSFEIWRSKNHVKLSEKKHWRMVSNRERVIVTRLLYVIVEYFTITILLSRCMRYHLDFLYQPYLGVNIKIPRRYQTTSYLKLFMSCLFLISCPGLHQDLQASTPKRFGWSHYHGIWSSIRLLPGMYKIQILGGQ